MSLVDCLHGSPYVDQRAKLQQWSTSCANHPCTHQPTQYAQLQWINIAIRWYTHKSTCWFMYIPTNQITIQNIYIPLAGFSVNRPCCLNKSWKYLNSFTSEITTFVTQTSCSIVDFCLHLTWASCPEFSRSTSIHAQQPKSDPFYRWCRIAQDTTPVAWFHDGRVLRTLQDKDYIP